MITPKILAWYSKMQDKGYSPKELEEELYQLGYTKKEVNEIQQKARKQTKLKQIKLPEKLPQKKNKNKKKYKEYTKSKEELKTPSMKQFLAKESKFIWSVILLSILFVLILLASTFIILFKPPDPIIVNPNETQDELPPQITIITPSEVMANQNIIVRCKDAGVDYSSGCVNSSISYLISPTASCPHAYYQYKKTLERQTKQGYLCVTAKDKEGNTGFSKPVKVQFDLSPPTTKIPAKKGWHQQDITLKIQDNDTGSQLKKCFYRILEPQKTITQWKERPCNNTINIPIGPGGCEEEGTRTCTIEAYAIDLAGNEGKKTIRQFDVDLNPPTVILKRLTPSKIEGSWFIITGKTQIIGTATDPNFKAYSLNWEGNNEKGYIIDSKKPVSDEVLAEFDVTEFDSGDYKLNLIAVDLTGKTTSTTTQFRIPEN